MTSRPPTSYERLFAAAFSLPMGLGAKLIDDLPTNITKAKQQIDLARSLGQRAIGRGAGELSARVCEAFRTRAAWEPTAMVAGRADKNSATAVDAAHSAVSDGVATDDTDSAADDIAVAEDELALVDYEQLPASHIISKLEGLTDEELAAVESYETAHRGRRTVLGKIQQIRTETT